MAKIFQAIRGMNDYLPQEILNWQYIEKILKNILNNYGYNEIRFPIVEQLQLFQRAIGEITDVVKKEMYIFLDRKGNNIALRPEGTASCVRASIENGLLYKKEQRLWYIGPMFRYERPQKGRYRQFHQIGVEFFGQSNPNVDAELIILTARWWRSLNISKYLFLEINSIGSSETRLKYKEVLITFFNKHKSFLEKNFKYLYINPMRILDTKNINIQKLLKDAPVLSDYLDKDSRVHFSNFCKILDAVGIPYKINPRLVRGLDYYNRTVFEWVTKNLGSHKTICGGGRYDNLVKQLGGKDTPAVGFAMGIERLLLLVQTVKPHTFAILHIDIYLVAFGGDNIQLAAVLLAEHLRNVLPKLRLMVNYNISNLKKQYSRANKYNAGVMLILGENEVAAQQVIIKNLFNGREEILLQNDLITKLISIFNLEK